MTSLLEHDLIPRTADAFPIAVGYPRIRRPRIVRTVGRRCLAVEGTGVPGGREFEAAMSALYGVAYGLMFLLRGRGIDAHTGPSEGLWERRDAREGWSEGAEAFDPEAWRWTLLMAVPTEATDEDIEAARAVARRRRPSEAVDPLRVIELDEGLVVEAMHVGPYAMEPETIATMRGFAEEAGFEPSGPHHEIYLGDPQRTAPENLRTVLRQPVRPLA